ncbi:MAG TPA: twin-arginine translocase TatA/TatE family subunit [Hanamia sp.]|nr:twin-arginine translocase TatA/TatE family subunit [Hanamia sp.]
MILLFKPEFLLSMPGGSEWILILLIALLFFGGKKIPDLMRGIGKGVREFNDAKESMKKEINDSKNEQAKRTSSEREVVKETDRNN